MYICLVVAECGNAVAVAARKKPDPSKCQCGKHKDLCSVDSCFSMYCKDSAAIENDKFKQCDCCGDMYCAHHMDFIAKCCECNEEFCHDVPCCEFCYEALCENCQGGHHQKWCLVDIAAAEQWLRRQSCSIWLLMSRRILRQYLTVTHVNLRLPTQMLSLM